MITSQMAGHLLAANVCSNIAVVFAAQNDVPEAAINDSFSCGEGRIPTRGKNNGMNTTNSFTEIQLRHIK
jgi:hypothetical protein